MDYSRVIKKNSLIYKQAISIIRSFKVKYRISWDNSECYALPYDEIIFIGAKGLSIQFFLSAVFHEIQHVLNKRNKKFFIYHNMNKVRTKKDIKRVIYTAVKAEKYTDKHAKKLLKKYFPDVKYIGYNEIAIDWFKNVHLPDLIEHLEDMVDYSRYIR